MDTIYKNNWKLFRSKQKSNKSSYDEIMNMLYPPSIQEQMKPSPLKIIQTLGALVYVLELYHINEVIKQQCFSSVLYFLGASLFNRIIANKKYSSRMKALQVRLNISYIQDWLRTNDLTPFRAPDFDFNDPKYPDSIVHEKISLKNVARFGNNPKDPMDATFYYSSMI
ncbi:unnamed protein product [Ambrosiozyma monospora]|uniref:Unnamed protein product n=1 Tax=Ambrosiozyma monospora TaxID=43982 RepID=A0ACB5UC61_AMBMO|nr:unnamed protein product [Ambrosiozyma monospora]